MKLGYSTWGMPTVPIDVIIPHLARLGYDGVELTVIPGYSIELDTLDQAERQRIAGLLKQHKLELPAIAGHRSLVAEDPASHAENMRRLKGTVDLAVDWAQDGRPPCIDTTAGGTPAEWDKLLPRLLDRLGELVAYAATRGVVIAIEPHVGSMLDTPDRVLEFLKLLPSPFLKLNFDISHFNVMGISIEESVSKLAAYSVHTHVKDERGAVPNFEFLIPGEGEFDYVTYLKRMRHYGYAGFISAEVSIMVQRRPNYDPLAAATMTYETLARAFREAGIERHK